MSHSCSGTPYCGNSTATVEPSITLSRHNLYDSPALMRLIPLAGDEFLPKWQRGGDIIEVDKLISTLQDNVQSRVLDPLHSVIIWAEKKEKLAARAVEVAKLFISLGGNSCFIRQFNTIKPLFFQEVFRCLAQTPPLNLNWKRFSLIAE